MYNISFLPTVSSRGWTHSDDSSWKFLIQVNLLHESTVDASTTLKAREVEVVGNYFTQSPSIPSYRGFCAVRNTNRWNRVKSFGLKHSWVEGSLPSLWKERKLKEPVPCVQDLLNVEIVAAQARSRVLATETSIYNSFSLVFRNVKHTT